MFSLGLLSLSLIPLSFAKPASIIGRQTGSGSTSPVSNDTIQNDFIRPALFTAMAYCPTANVLAQNCGFFCDQLQGIQILTAGGGKLLWRFCTF
jgi:hypothetical protein